MATSPNPIDASQDNATPTPISTFEGVAIPTSLATTIQYEDGITIKTQVFGQGTVVVEPVEDPVSQQADENVGFVFDPATGEMVPSDSTFAQELITESINPDNDPNVLALMEATRQQAEDEFEFGDAPTEADLIDEEALLSLDNVTDGDAGTGLGEPPEVDPENEPLRTPDGGIDGEGDAGTGLTEPPTDSESSPENNYVAQKTKPALSKPKDWRVRISLAPGADYLYAASNAGILSPLKDTAGVIFPYTPAISVSYNAKYDTQSPTHSNYNIYNYQGSSVEAISITGDFTAQSVTEANYLLAVIHFFKSSTKMFYGKDAQRGTPPPLLYLSGYGQYQFDNHPMVLTGFTYSLPQDVDYVDAYSTDDNSTTGMAINGVSLSAFVQPNRNTRPAQNLMSSLSRLLSGATKIEPGGKVTPNSFKKSPDSVKSITRVPSKISISLTLNPMITRQAINDHFSLKDYATGKLLRGSSNKGTGGGIW